MSKTALFVALVFSTLANAKNFVGQVQLPAGFNGYLGAYSVTNISPAVSVDWSSYAGLITSYENLYARLCVSWTDNGDNSDGIQLMLFDRMHGVYSASFATTWSDRQLHNVECSRNWIPVYFNGINQICRDGWGTECYVQVRYYSPSKSGAYVTINSVWLEIWER